MSAQHIVPAGRLLVSYMNRSEEHTVKLAAMKLFINALRFQVTQKCKHKQN